MIEFIPDTNSIDYLKRKFPRREWTLKDFFEKYFEDDFE